MHSLAHYFCLQNMLLKNTWAREKAPRNTYLEQDSDIYMVIWVTHISEFFILILFLILITSKILQPHVILHGYGFLLAVTLHVQRINYTNVTDKVLVIPTSKFVSVFISFSSFNLNLFLNQLHRLCF